MANFVTDNTPLPPLKANAHPPVDPTHEIDAEDVNNLWAAAGDLRDHATGWVNVKTYGARGDGTTDDTAAIQAAINTGKPVFFPPGTYSVTGLTAVTGGGIFGYAQTATIKLATGFTTALTIPVANFFVSGLRFDGGNVGPYNGPAVTQGTRTGISIAGAQNVVQNVIVRDCYATGFNSAGLYLGQTAQGVSGNLGATVVHIVGFTASVNFIGIFLDQNAEYVQLSDCVCVLSRDAIRCIGGNHRIVNSHFGESMVNCHLMPGANAHHGSFVGCSFNHANALSGGANGLIAFDVTLGEIFEGCDFWYSDMSVQDCGGLTIIGCNIANTAISTFYGGTYNAGTNLITNNWLTAVTRSFDQSIKLVWEDNVIDGTSGPTALAYSASIAVDASANDSFTVTPTNGTAFTINNPTNQSVNRRMVIRVVNTFGTLGAITMGSAFAFPEAPTFPVVSPASALAIEFRYDGTSWVEIGRTGTPRRKFVAVAQTTSWTINASTGDDFQMNVVGNVAITVNAPTNPISGQRITIGFMNSSGGAITTPVAWNAAFKMATWTNPASGQTRLADFRYDGAAWKQIGTPLDVPN